MKHIAQVLDITLSSWQAPLFGFAERGEVETRLRGSALPGEGEALSATPDGNYGGNDDSAEVTV